MSAEEIVEGREYRLRQFAPVTIGATATTTTVDATRVRVDYGPDVVDACEVTLLDGELAGVGDMWVNAAHLSPADPLAHCPYCLAPTAGPLAGCDKPECTRREIEIEAAFKRLEDI